MKRLLCTCCLLALFLTACGGTNLPPAGTGPINTPTVNKEPTAFSATTVEGIIHEYPLPQSNSGLMRPAVDHEGRIWFGEMGRNYLAYFDPRTRTFQQMTPPRGHDGIMGVQVAPDDSIWFAEQYANYIGHYFPTTGQYQVYNLPALTIPDPSDTARTLTLPGAPNDIALDAHGNVWFTELNADSVGKLNPHTGITQQYPLSNKKSVQTLDPYGITVDAQGIVWFTESTNDHVGRLDPSTGQIQFFTMPGPPTQLMEIASDMHGIIWITAFNSGLLLSFNPRTDTFTPYYAPFTAKGAGGLYGLTISTSGEIWVTITEQNIIARLDVAARRFIYYPVPTPASLPLGLVIGANHTVWFTEAGSNKIGMLKP